MSLLSRKMEIMVGILFIIATLSFILGGQFIADGIDASSNFHDLDSMKIQIGVLLQFINSVSVVGIAVIMHSILQKRNFIIAFSYLSSRIIESVVLLVGSLGPLIFALISKGDSKLGIQYLTFSYLVIQWQNVAFQISMLVLGLGSLFFCYFLYVSKLIPRLLSLLGFIGYIALLASSLLEIFGFGSGEILFIPGAIFEIVFPLWLIIKGFSKDNL